MTKGIFHQLSHFFPRKLSPELRELYVAMSLSNVATSAIMLFEPLYFLSLGLSIPTVLSFYLAVYLCYLFLLPLGGRFAIQYGFNRAMVASSIFTIGYYLSLLALPFFYWAWPFAVFMYAAQKTLYWPSYHADFARYGKSNEEGREVSNRELLDLLANVTGPVVGGLIISQYGFASAFVAACAIIVASNIPLLLVRDNILPHKHFTYRETFGWLTAIEHRRQVISFFGYGEELILLVLWPIYMHTIIPGFFSLGSLVGGTTLLTVLALLYLGRRTDHSNKRSVLKMGSIFYTVVWAMRLGAVTASSVFWADAASRLAKRMVNVPLLSLVYAEGRQTHHAMHTALMFEMSLVLGKLTAIVIGLAIFTWFPLVAWPIIFLLAAAFTLLYTRL